MKRDKDKIQEPFLMVFPWGKVALALIVIGFIKLFIYRFSGVAGDESSRACLSAIVIAGIGGILGIFVISKTWRRDVYFVLAGAMIAMSIRLLISGGGAAIIMRFTEIHRSWFVLYLGIYYAAFLVVDTWLAMWILRNSELKDQEKAVHGNLWDIFS